MDTVDQNEWFYYKSSLMIGELEMFIIKYDLYEGYEILDDLTLDPLWLKIKNINQRSYRARYLVEPYFIYADLRTENYHHL